MTYRTRFAPSPNGCLHLGHAFSALTVNARAKANGGEWLLRHEDIDAARCPPELKEGVEEDLQWLGLKWSGPAIHQSTRKISHLAALEKLKGLGLLYPCFASRGEIKAHLADKADWPNDPDGSPIYPSLHKTLSTDEVEERIARGEPFALRLDMEKALKKLAKDLSFLETGSGMPQTISASPEIWGDVVLGRKDIGTSYHIAVVVDDALDQITEVVRGEDLFAATHLHVLLQALLELTTPIYHHHRLITDEAGKKLSKSDGDTSLKALRETGKTALELRSDLGF